MTTPRERAKSSVVNLVSSIEKKGIRVVAVDFDQTLIKIHSGGVWKDSTDNLAKHIRPCMKDLLEVSLQRELIVCIVTFHSQPWVIRELLKKLLKKDAEKIYVQANTIEFRERHNYEYLGKEAHITAVLTEVYNRQKVIIKPQEIILFDDDQDNVDTALKFGHWAFQIKDDVSYNTFEEYSQMLALQDKPPGMKGKKK
ncbi:uncharacterized protein LOC133197740 [Saccostrea echinata]|uniref:uncharacterized protein LOC133197740 n=1 Tax=Saccostrea echinata TaxID=191078 RepID=UPI002A8109CD|nr:uncharacterized protein LOC133197740 [Saccostrea echinata]